jgi:hypothetical protein
VNDLQKTLLTLESYISKATISNEKVSNATVGWHIDHSLMVINKVLSQLEKSDEKDYKSNFNLKRFVIFLKGKMPIGVAKAPEAVKPTQVFNEAETLLFIEKAKNKVEMSMQLSKNKNFKHPFFGLLNTPQTLKFLNIHTKHHIQIIENILA